jgi:hypothetical protein
VGVEIEVKEVKWKFSIDAAVEVGGVEVGVDSAGIILEVWF